MSRENVEALRAVYEGWARGDFRTGMGLYDPHIMLVTRPDLPDGGRYVGVESISAYMREYLDPFEEITWTAEELIEADGSVVAVTRQRGAARGSGLSVEGEIFLVWTFRGRAVIRLEFFADRAKALEAVGLSEEAMSQENVGLALSLYDAFNRRDLDAYLALMHADAVAGSRLTEVEGEYRGHDGIQRWWNSFLDTLPDYVVYPAAVRHFGDITVAELRAEGHGAGSAAPINETFWQTARWQGGKCLWWRNFTTEREALEAVGLRE